MNIKTKKYQLESKTYVNIALKNVMKKYWWAWLVPVAIMLIPIFSPGALWWCFGIALTLSILYVLFWVIQFSAITKLDQYKMLFERLSYEINSQKILIKLNAKQGMPVNWEQIQNAKKGKDYFILELSMAQFIYLPFSIFKGEHEVKFLESILKRKGLIATPAKVEDKAAA
ncbi:MAG: YcxB family protein [Flammeovirgaceae bacterium]